MCGWSHTVYCVCVAGHIQCIVCVVTYSVLCVAGHIQCIVYVWLVTYSVLCMCGWSHTVYCVCVAGHIQCIVYVWLVTYSVLCMCGWSHTVYCVCVAGHIQCIVCVAGHIQCITCVLCVAGHIQCIVCVAGLCFTHTGDDELDGARLLPSPGAQLHDEPLDTLKHQLRPLQTPRDCHLLATDTNNFCIT